MRRDHGGGGSKQIGQRKRRKERDGNATNAHPHEGTDFEESGANARRGCVGKRGVCEHVLAEVAHPKKCKRLEHQVKLVGRDDLFAHAVGEQVEWMLLDVVFHQRSLAVVALVQVIAGQNLLREVGNDESSIGLRAGPCSPGTDRAARACIALPTIAFSRALVANPISKKWPSGSQKRGCTQGVGRRSETHGVVRLLKRPQLRQPNNLSIYQINLL